MCLYKKDKNEASSQVEMAAINGRLIEGPSNIINVELVSVLEKDHNFTQSSCRTSCHYNELNCKETLHRIYQTYHTLQKQKSYFEHVKDVTADLNMIEIAIDEAWTLGRSI